MYCKRLILLNEIVDDLIRLKNLKNSNPKNNDFSNKIKQITGKSFAESEFENLISLNNNALKEKINNKFKDSRDKRVKIIGEAQSKEIEKRIFLQTIDMNWKSHIQYLEQLRQVIGLRSYGQRDPLIEYKKEAFDLFENLLNKLKQDLVTILMNLQVVATPREKIEDPKQKRIDPKYVGKKMSRNEPCLCGSGKNINGVVVLYK